MKNLVFYEVNENTQTLPLLSDNEGDVFDAVNDSGAITECGLTKKVGGLTLTEIRQALDSLMGAQVIVRRTLSAHDTD